MTDFDIAVIGGGIHGACVAERGAAAGYRVLLLERTRPACGTSSRSSKLIHGGLRYLESGQFRLVRECLRERRILLERAPELVRLTPFLIPLYRHSLRRPWQIAAGLSLYSLLAGAGPGSGFGRLPQAQWAELDGLATGGLRQVFRYYDGQTDDRRLTEAVLRSAERLGARVDFPAEFLGATPEPGGWRIALSRNGQDQQLRTAALVNAAGPWVNEVLGRIDGAPPPLPVDWVQGTHVLLEGPTTRGIYYVEAEDGRAVFVMPWGDATLVGTTETVFSGDPSRVEPQQAEIDYLRRVHARHFPARAEARLLDAFAGLRVLPRSADRPFARPRETLFLTDRRQPPRLVAIYGGKLTAARATADEVVMRLAPALPNSVPRADTRRLRLEPESAS